MTQLDNAEDAHLCAVAWDIDGTLVDSEPVHLLALQRVCQDHGVDISDLAEDHFIGVHVHDVWQALAPRFGRSFSPAQWTGAINAHYLGLANRLKPMPGALAVVAELTRRGVRQVAVSNSPRSVVQANLAVVGLAAHMAFTVSLDDVANGKPDPEPYAKAARLLALPPARMLAVEDSLTGLRSAQRAGLRAIGYGAPAALKEVANRCVLHLVEVLDEFGRGDGPAVLP